MRTLGEKMLAAGTGSFASFGLYAALGVAMALGRLNEAVFRRLIRRPVIPRP
jgi:hypothetical protein